ncbi:unnamed protein product, partial [Ectocarpus sp. 6 AP-2014]
LGKRSGSPPLYCALWPMSVTSAWISRRKSIKKLLIFFSHWLRVGADLGVGTEDCTTSTQDKQIHLWCGWM